MTDDAIRAGLGRIFADVFGRDVPLMDATTAADVAGWDSLKQIEIIVAVEERFGVKLRTREIDALKSVGDLVRLIEIKAR